MVSLMRPSSWANAFVTQDPAMTACRSIIATLRATAWMALLALPMAGCSSFDQRMQEDTRLLVEYALRDFPIPDTADINVSETVILGSGNQWAGKIDYSVPMSPQELLKYYAEATPANGWTLSSSTVSKTIVLVFEKNDRLATVEINRMSFLNDRVLISHRRSNVVVSLNHANSVGSGR